jgi:hypothetical protein
MKLLAGSTNDYASNLAISEGNSDFPGVFGLALAGVSARRSVTTSLPSTITRPRRRRVAGRCAGRAPARRAGRPVDGLRGAWPAGSRCLAPWSLATTIVLTSDGGVRERRRRQAAAAAERGRRRDRMARQLLPNPTGHWDRPLPATCPPPETNHAKTRGELRPLPRCPSLQSGGSATGPRRAGVRNVES